MYIHSWNRYIQGSQEANAKEAPCGKLNLCPGYKRILSEMNKDVPTINNTEVSVILMNGYVITYTNFKRSQSKPV